MDSIKTIVEGHKKQERPYPRPIIDCPECSEKAIICWGEKIIEPYLRHSSKRKCKPSPESWQHKEAKTRLCKFLNEGGVCRFAHSCPEGRKVIDLPSQISYSEEVKFGNSRLDIGGTNAEGKVLVNIEILRTHKTTNVEDRNTILWVEIEAVEVLDLLDVDPKPERIQLKDKGTKPCCYAKPIAVSSEGMENMSDQSVQAIITPQRNSYSLDDFSSRERLVRIPSPSERNSTRELPEGFPFPTEEIREKLAMRLGYMKRIVPHRAKIVHRLVVKGRVVRFKEEWFTVIADRPPVYVWEEFLEYQRCLYCGDPWKTDWYKPYCRDCYTSIKNEEVNYKDLLEIPNSLKQELRRKLSWLDYIENDSNVGSPCDLCRKTERTDGLPSYVWWFGKKKCLCWECFDQRLEKDKVYDILDIAIRALENE